MPVTIRVCIGRSATRGDIRPAATDFQKALGRIDDRSKASMAEDAFGVLGGGSRTDIRCDVQGYFASVRTGRG